MNKKCDSDLTTKQVCWIFGIVVACFLFFGFLPFLLSTDKSMAGIFGDSFGFANALFSGLAFAGVIITLFRQGTELKLQQEELKATRDELRRTAEAHEQSLIARMRPILVFNRYDDEQMRWRLSNVGEGAALEIILLSYHYRAGSQQELGQTKVITIFPLRAGNDWHLYWFSGGYKLEVVYKDVAGHAYKTELRDHLNKVSSLDVYPADLRTTTSQGKEIKRYKEENRLNASEVA